MHFEPYGTIGLANDQGSKIRDAALQPDDIENPFCDNSPQTCSKPVSTTLQSQSQTPEDHSPEHFRRTVIKTITYRLEVVHAVYKLIREFQEKSDAIIDAQDTLCDTLETKFNTINDHSPSTSSEHSVTSKDYSLEQLEWDVRRTAKDLKNNRNTLLTEVVCLKWGFKARCDDISDALDALCEKLEDQFNAATEKLQNLVEQYKAWLTEKEMKDGQVIARGNDSK